MSTTTVTISSNGFNLREALSIRVGDSVTFTTVGMDAPSSVNVTGDRGNTTLFGGRSGTYSLTSAFVVQAGAVGQSYRISAGDLGMEVQVDAATRGVVDDYAICMDPTGGPNPPVIDPARC